MHVQPGRPVGLFLMLLKQQAAASLLLLLLASRASWVRPYRIRDLKILKKKKKNEHSKNIKKSTLLEVG